MRNGIHLVTGGAGFIGSHLIRRLLASGCQVRVVDNFVTGRRANLKGLEDQIEVIEGDVRDMNLVREAVSGVEYVYHQAALTKVERSVQDPVPTTETNVLGTLSVLLGAAKAGVKKVIYASSSSVYGDNARLPKREMMRPKPRSPYAASKLGGEQYCMVFSDLHRLPTVSLRYFNVYGPAQDPESRYAAVIPNFITAMLRGERPTVFGDGRQSRDFTFVDDVVEANLLAAKCETPPGAVYNIGSGRRHNLLELLGLLEEILETEAEPRFGAPRPGDVRHTLADVSKARKDLGFSPRISFRSGLQKTAAWFVEYLAHEGSLRVS